MPSGCSPLDVALKKEPHTDGHGGDKKGGKVFPLQARLWSRGWVEV